MGVITKLNYLGGGWGVFLCILVSFLNIRLRYIMGIYFFFWGGGVAKSSNNFWVCQIFLIIFGGINSRCWVQAYVARSVESIPLGSECPTK